MKLKSQILFHLYFLIAEGIFCLLLLLRIPSDPKNSFFLGYSKPRLLLLLIILAGIFLFASFVFQTHLRVKFAAFLSTVIDSVSRKNHTVLPSILMSALFLGFLFIANWRYFPGANAASLYRLYPVSLFITLVLLHLAIFLSVVMRITEKLFRLSLILFYTGLAIFYFNVSSHYSTINREYQLSDQRGYMNFTRKVYDSSFSYTGSRNSMPVYPFVQALFYENDLNNAELFQRGKLVNILLSMSLLLIMFYIFHKLFPLPSAMSLGLVSAFSLYVYKAGYYQPELLFYFLAFISFLLMCRLLVIPNKILAIIAGVFLGIAHLTKASILPGLAIFSLVYLLMIIRFAFLRNSESADNLSATGKPSLIVLLLVLISFLSTVFPYVNESKQIYGKYLYNVNTTFYIWYDSWAEAKLGTRAYGDSEGWPNMPPEEIPSLRKYISSHSFSDIATRLYRGVMVQIINLAEIYGPIPYAVLFALLLVILMTFNWKTSIYLLKKYPFVVSFTLAFFVSYILAFGWYRPISAGGQGRRFTYGLFVPLLFSFSYAANRIAERSSEGLFAKIKIVNLTFIRNFNLGIIILLLVDLLYFVPANLSRFDWYGK